MKPFLFLHIPKTGGVTFHNIISNQFRFKKQFLYTPRNAVKWGAFSNEKKAKYEVVKGHFLFGGKEFYPHDCNYFTFLRDPEKRIISHYQHLRATSDHKRHDFAMKNSLADFLKNVNAPFFDNCMVRYLSGNSQKAYGEINESDLEIAIRNFDTYFQHFGLIEKYDESLILLTYELDWKTPFYVTMNKGKAEVKPEITEETRELLMRYSKYDRMLWQHAVKRFEVKTEKYGVKLKADVENFRKQNAKNLFLRTAYYELKEKIFRLIG